MEILIKRFNGTSIVLVVEPPDTIEEVKQKIQQREGISSDAIRLIFGDRELENHRTLRDYNVHELAILEVLGYMRGK